METTSPYHTNLDDAPRRPLRLGRGESALLVDEAHGRAANVDIHVNHLLPGSGPGPRHFHERAENVYIVLDGAIEVEVEGEIFTLQAHHVLFIPPGSIHATCNPGEVAATFIEVYAPAGRDFHIVDEPEEI